MHETNVIDDPLMRLIEWHTPEARPRPRRRATPDGPHGERLGVVRMPGEPPSSQPG